MTTKTSQKEYLDYLSKAAIKGLTPRKQFWFLIKFVVQADIVS